MAPLDPAASGAAASAYVKPRPRPPKSPAHAAQIRVQNRRREYLERHPSYFLSAEHELADPLLYDALVRRFQTAAERERAGRAQGYGRVLEMDLMRGEARLAHHLSSTSSGPSSSQLPDAISPSAGDADAYIREYADASGEPPAADKDAAAGRWRAFLRRRFVLGRDDDFDYRAVDRDPALDAVERREQEDAWIENEEPGWASEDGEGQGESETLDEEEEVGGDGGAESTTRRTTRNKQKKKDKRKVDRPLSGETGVQDF
ncbi:hypothetical protein F4780DRAFT_781874 [Xylariomycetidae sp. FL0641]|nr:hypothetical protein F4780DRAFT_781874 [Xylariomycetidae sp. FL0641]